MCVFVVSNLVDCRRFRLPTCCGWRMVHLPLGDLSREKEERVKKKGGQSQMFVVLRGIGKSKIKQTIRDASFVYLR